jgi:DNA processing protein
LEVMSVHEDDSDDRPAMAPRPDPGEPARLARARLSFLADPGDPALGRLLALCEPDEILASVSADRPVRLALPGGGRGMAELERAVTRWRSRLPEVPSAARLAGWERTGYRLVCPGDPEWPSQLDDLGDARPVVLWLRGGTDLRFACLRSVAVVGARAATAYGTYVAAELAADVAGRGWTVISGGAFGVDACAHRGALAAEGTTVAVLASGLGFGYPKGNESLFEAIASTGVMVSECPPDRAPTRPGFLVRNRIIAALSRGTVVIEAARRSGALNTARHARELNRPVMAVPGPITSEQSAGCHDLIRETGATCVTSAAEVIELVAPLGECDSGATRGPAVRADALDPVTAAVLRAVARRSGRGPATIATLAGVDLDTAIRCLGLLAAAGHVERCERGWRMRKEGGEWQEQT